MKIYNLCYIWKDEKGDNFGNIIITTKKRLNERIRDIVLDDKVWFAKIRYEELLHGEFKIRETQIVKQVTGDPK